jgi:hypothetical protein
MKLAALTTISVHHLRSGTRTSSSSIRCDGYLRTQVFYKGPTPSSGNCTFVIDGTYVAATERQPTGNLCSLQ